MKKIFKKIIFVLLYPVFGLIIFTIPNMYVVAVEDSDSVDTYEQKLYKDYVQYYSKTISAENWSSLVGNKDTYKVRKKDTLWDISKVLFGDSQYWPKLWSVNPNIKNPHLIKPNDNLGFTPGTEDVAPLLSIVKNKVDKKNSFLNALVTVPKFIRLKKIKVADSKKIVPVMQNLPSSLSVLKLVNSEDDLANLEINFLKIDQLNVDSNLKYYLRNEEIKGIGFIVDKKEYGSVFHIGQRVILKMHQIVVPGQKLTIINNKGKFSPHKSGISGPFGYQVEVQGEVEIIGKIPDSLELYESKITQSLNPITLGSRVIERKIINFNHHSTNNKGNSEAQIVGVPNGQNMIFLYSLVFLNRGFENGISVGQMYQVKSNPDFHILNFGYNIKVGEVKIVHVANHFSTGVITSMSNPIIVGDNIMSLDKTLVLKSTYDPTEDDLEEVQYEKDDTSGDLTAEDIELSEEELSEEKSDEEELSEEESSEEESDEEESSEEESDEEESDDNLEQDISVNSIDTSAEVESASDEEEDLFDDAEF